MTLLIFFFWYVLLIFFSLSSSRKARKVAEIPLSVLDLLTLMISSSPTGKDQSSDHITWVNFTLSLFTLFLSLSLLSLYRSSNHHFLSHSLSSRIVFTSFALRLAQTIQLFLLRSDSPPVSIFLVLTKPLVITHLILLVIFSDTLLSSWSFTYLLLPIF